MSRAQMQQAVRQVCGCSSVVGMQVPGEVTLSSVARLCMDKDLPEGYPLGKGKTLHVLPGR